MEDTEKKNTVIKRGIIIISSIAASVIILLVVLFIIPLQPSTIKEGTQTYRLGTYNLSKEGFNGFNKMIKATENLKGSFNISSFRANVDKNANVKDFTLSLNVYDNSKYIGTASYQYKDGKLTYSKPKDISSGLIFDYNTNSEIDYLDKQIKKIPLAEQIKKSELSHYVIEYQPYTQIKSGTPIFDGREGNSFDVLSKADYNAAKGGKSDGKTNVVIRLFDGISIVSGQQYLYVFKPANEKTATGNPQSMMKCDYYINNGKLQFTRNYGESFIDTDIEPSQLKETLSFYRSNMIPWGSYFISEDESLPIAYFYGANPVLKYSHDNGKTWNESAFPKTSDFDIPVTRRFVGFTSKDVGFAAFGTDYTNGTGEAKACCFTKDGGKTWDIKYNLPDETFGHPLKGFMMCDENNGIVAVDGGQDANFPIFYATSDRGKTYTKIDFGNSFGVDYITGITSFTKKDGVFTLTLGQGDKGTKKSIFTSTDIKSGWQFEKTENQTIHTVG